MGLCRREQPSRPVIACETEPILLMTFFARCSQGGGLVARQRTGLSGIRNSCRRWNNACDSTRPLSGLMNKYITPWGRTACS